MNAIVFGGASGIGAATVEIFAKAGHRVVVADLVEPTEHPWRWVDCDVTEPLGVEAGFRSFAAGSPDAPELVVVTAGYQSAAALGDTYPIETRKLFDINALAAVRILKAAVNHMDQGSVTFVSSVAGITSGGPGLAVYGASKAALIGLTKSAARELAPRIRVNCVCPGWTDTDFNAPVAKFVGGKTKVELIVQRDVPLRRQATPQEIAEVIAFVSQATYMTGSIVVADGGLSA